MAEDDGAVDPSAEKFYNHLSKVDTEKLMGTTNHSSNSNNGSTPSEKATTESTISSQRHTIYLKLWCIRL